MRFHHSYRRFIGLALGIALVSLLASPAAGVISPNVPYQSATLNDPTPGAFAWNSSIAYYTNQVIYCGDDKKIYAYDLDTGVSIEIYDTSGLGGAWGSVSGFLVSYNNYLYFHDNGSTKNIYRILLTNPAAGYTSFDTGCAGSIYAFTQNPWTGAIWFASADFPPGNMYLYEVNAPFDTATQRVSFAQPHNGGNGPIIFTGTNTLLYGESVWGGEGYFHLVDSTAGTLLSQDYLTFAGGLAATASGYDNVIYATTGGGKTIYKIQGATKTVVASTDDNAQGISFDGTSFYVSEMSGTGTVGFKSLQRVQSSQQNGTSVVTDGGGGGCFIGTIVTGSPFQNWNVSPLIYIVLILTASYPVARLFKIKR